MPKSLARGSPVAEAHAVPLADGRSRADPEAVLQPSAVALAQRQALPASPTPASGVRRLPPEQLAAGRPERSAETRPGRPAPIAAAHAARPARGPDARNPVHPEDGPAWVPAGPH